jgi:lytic murein transglycosylase
VVQAVATLAANGRRRDWAESQLFAALKILATTPIPRAQLKGSWAGAMGQTQFIPETYLATAIDADGDGKRDIWGSSQDALASAANLMAKEGWKAGQPWHREVVLPASFDFGLAEGPRQPYPAWSALGARTADGAALSEADAALPAGLIVPQGWQGPAFLVFANHFVIRRYNNSTAYALAVGLLADRIGGAGPVVTPWPPEGGLSIADRKGAQEALARLGYSPGAADGVIGTNTRAQLRLWQKARQLPADGHLTPELAQRLIAEAAS